MKHVSVRACFLHELKEVNQNFMYLDPYNSKHGGYIYNKNVSQKLHGMVVRDDDNEEEECHKYLYEILDMSHVTITNSPGEGVASGQSEPAVGSRNPAPTDKYDVDSGESSGLLKRGRREPEYVL